MVHRQEKSQFFHRKKDVWDRLTEEMRRSEELAAQLAATRQVVAELAPIAREKDAGNDAHEAREKLMALIKRVECDLAHQERTNT